MSDTLYEHSENNYRITGPASGMLQGASIELAGAAAVLNDSRKQFEDLRSNADL